MCGASRLAADIRRPGTCARGSPISRVDGPVPSGKDHDEPLDQLHRPGSGGRVGGPHPSLNDLATAKGVSHEDLIAAIKKGLESARSAAGGTSTDEDLTAVAERIAARTPGTGRPVGAPPAGGPRPGGPPPMGGPRRAGGDGDGDADDTTSATSDDDDATASVFAALSATLDMTVAELLSSLASGTSLTDLASSKGVSASTVGSVASTGLQYDQRL
jgi:hypothetical protein